MPVAMLLLWLSLIWQSATDADLKNAAPPKPSVFVSFGRQTIQESDSVQVSVWLANDSEHELTDVRLHIASPDFLEWYEQSCDGKPFANGFALGSVQPASTLTRQFCVKTKPLIKVGEFNTSFVFQYRWRTEKGIAASFVSQEKTIKVNILGSDNVAGIPLALAGFIVPGLFFWLVVRVFKAPWYLDTVLGDKVIDSIIISVCIVAIGSWIGFVSVNSGVSLNKLMLLAGVGSVAGLLTGATDFIIRRIRLYKLKAKQIEMGDDEKDILRKILKQRQPTRPTVEIVRLKNNEEYIGSLVSRTATTTTLIGWFRISLRGQPPHVARKLRTLEQQRKLVKVFDLAKRHNIKIEVDDAVQLRQDEDDEQNTGTGAQQWENADVAGWVEAEEARNDKLPLRLVD